MFMRTTHQVSRAAGGVAKNSASRRVPSCAAAKRQLRLLSSSSPNSNNNNNNTTFSGYLGALRLKAANALTSTLPEEEKTRLLEKLGAHDNEEDSALPSANDSDDEAAAAAQAQQQHSIEEAIAMAKAKEAERYEEKWEKQKEALVAEAEEAARRRIQSDLEIQKRQLAFEAWKKELEKEKQEDDASSSSSSSNLEVVPTAFVEQEEETNLGDHPILGPVVADLGEKRIHLVSSRALAAIPVWKKQRIYRHSRAKSMANDKLKSLHLGLPGVIGIYEASDGSLKIIDGQHRIGMLKVLEEKAAADDFGFDKILVEVYPQKDQQNEDAHARDLFLEVNKAEPVKLVDLPGVAKAADRKIINEGADRLMDKFPDMFSPSQRCRAPHLNIDNLRDALFASNVITKHSLKTPKALEQWMLAQNEVLATKFQTEESRKLVSANALKKAEKFDFYLGLDSSWLYN